MEKDQTIENGSSDEGLMQILPIISLWFHQWGLMDLENQLQIAKYATSVVSDDDLKNDNKNVLQDIVKRVLTVRYKPPSQLLAPLLPFQEEGLAWMCNQEVSPVRGGILADEMGMGKTIQMIALLLTRKYDSNPVESVPNSVKNKDHDFNPEGRGATLVIAPLAAVLQWKQEIERFSKPGSLRVLLYHGSCREALLKSIHLYDVVVTTYPTVESDYRRVINTHKVTCKYCGRMYLPEKLRFHQRYFCGPEAAKTARQAKTEKKTERNCSIPTPNNVLGEILQSAGRLEDFEKVRMGVPWLGRRKALVSTDEESEKAEDKNADDKNEDEDASHPSGSRLLKRATGKRKREFLDSFCKLIEMGFDGEAASIAIQTSNGNLQSALRMLSTGAEAERSPPPSSEVSDEEEMRRSGQLKAGPKRRAARGKKTEEPFKESSERSDAEEGKERNEAMGNFAKEERRKRAVIERAHTLRATFNISKTELGKKRVAELQKMLKSIDESSFGTKQELVNRLSLLLFPVEAEEQESDGSMERDSEERVEKRKHVTSSEGIEGRESGKKKTASKVKGAKSHKMSNGVVKKTVKGVRKVVKEAKQKRKNSESSEVVRKRPLRRCRSASKDPKVRFVGSESDTSRSSDSDVEEIEVVSSSDDSEVRKEARKKERRGGEIAQVINEGKDALDEEMVYEDPYATTDEDEGVDMSLSPLHSITWKRIVLDEAHRIKGRTTSTAKAIYALRASKSKWCLSGTPLQNRVGELYSLVRFLRYDPYAFYFCSKKDCRCRSLHFRFVNNRYCVKCGHPRMSHYSYFNRKIVSPIQKYGYQGEGREAMKALKEDILDTILLRRTKLERAEDVKLPSLTVLIRRDQLSQAERDFYESLYKQTRTEFNTYIESGTLLHNYAHIFDLLSRLRQAVDHPYLVVYGNLAPTFSGSTVEIPAPGRGNSEVCGLCQDDVDDPNELSVSRCKHAFHKTCIADYVNQAPGTDGVPLGCPVCYSPLTVGVETEAAGRSKKAAGSQEGILSKIKTSEFQSSTKIEALVQELESIAEKDSTSKSIVFSQYTSMLELVEWRLKKGGVQCAKLIGSLSLTARTNILYAFNSDPSLKVVLISLKAGGEGLNLQIANNVFLLDPWWNPASEQQAIQRAHRIGQNKPVRAVRFICEGTIEEKILQLQEKKQLVFDGTVGASAESLAKLTSEDLCFLFRN
ncbi:LOW QUALITY PROTEIN: uncharacterized protein LOC129618345 [Condylostylus longicornis]|uniref:LOW QUALITY PROTEIN: uncharacterized protein LOC129618345 n=1 Tax=Condylostylus longicornis TaxID=2530218 RepID=UPI00244E24D5|nr:LOW QUALITY PROTEIN: uncharacterized protein LOC129618345 [Condylostylus longicornis]